MRNDDTIYPDQQPHPHRSIASSRFPHHVHHAVPLPSPPQPQDAQEAGYDDSQRPKLTAGPGPILKAYLLAFNAISALAWGYLLYLTLWFILTPRSGGAQGSPGNYRILGQSARSKHPLSYVAKLANHLTGGYRFHGLGEATKWVQTLAVMEVVHAALGWVRSPVGTVASQVASRLWAVWGVVEMVPKVSLLKPLTDSRPATTPSLPLCFLPGR